MALDVTHPKGLARGPQGQAATPWIGIWMTAVPAGSTTRVASGGMRPAPVESMRARMSEQAGAWQIREPERTGA